ncbi:mutS protein homolog 4-like [Arctopsyche grandis]|uniref:mutS protein homolog 4-like n=1 Tax=Arctopsyche grandis TaxID=121162 RepID=UPI00406D720D
MMIACQVNDISRRGVNGECEFECECECECELVCESRATAPFKRQRRFGLHDVPAKRSEQFKLFYDHLSPDKKKKMNVARGTMRPRTRGRILPFEQRSGSKLPRYSFDLNTMSNKNNISTNTAKNTTTSQKGSTSRGTLLSTTCQNNQNNSLPIGVRNLNSASSHLLNSSSIRNFTPQLKSMFNEVTSSISRGSKRAQPHTTPGSGTNNATMSDTCIIVAISEGRGAAKGEVGIASIDLRRPQLILCQISDTHSYIHTMTKLHYFNPKEIIVPNTFNANAVVNELYKLISDQFKNTQITPIRRNYFSDTEGFQQIKELCAPEYINVQLQLMHKFYAVTAAAALLKYVEQIQCITFASKSLKIEYFASQNTTLIDVDTAIRLELVESLSGVSDRRSCLLSILNYTSTSGGLRHLRANILQPPCDLNIINTRLDCVEELLENDEGLMPSLKRIIRQLLDADKILWLCMMLPVQDGNKAGEAQLNHTLLLKTTMEVLPSLVAALELAKGSWFLQVKRDLQDPKFDEIREQIKKVLQDDAHLTRGAGSHFQRCFAVRPNINGLLDVARKSYSELITDIQDKVTHLGETYNLPLKLNNNSARGFHIALSAGGRNKNNTNININNLPSIFMEVQRHAGSVTMTTEEMMLLNIQAKESLGEIQTMSNIVICNLLEDLRSYMTILYKLCDHIAELDVILSLAQVSSGGNYARPAFNEYLELKDCIHPILDCVIQTSPVPNDVFSSPEYNFHIITGPNMGGKSIYIKQIAILQIMAQIGCFVPASSAVFRLSDHIFSRIGFNDNIECNASSYVLEMKEIQYILQTMTPRSLIIIDELCRGTSSEEGTSMAWAICERLFDTQAFTFFTTHFLYLTKLQNVYLNVINLHTETTKSDATGELIYNYKVVPGVTNIENYGLTLAKNTNLPESVTGLAEDLIKVISKYKKASPISEDINLDEYALYALAANLIQESRKMNTTNDDLKNILDKFKIENPYIFEKIRQENCEQYSRGNFINLYKIGNNNIQSKANVESGEKNLSSSAARDFSGVQSSPKFDMSKTPNCTTKNASTNNNLKSTGQNLSALDILNLNYSPDNGLNSTSSKAHDNDETVCTCNEDYLTYDHVTNNIYTNENPETECPVHKMDVLCVAKRQMGDFKHVKTVIDHLNLKKHLDSRLSNNINTSRNFNSVSSTASSTLNHKILKTSHDSIVCEPDILNIQNCFD